MRGMNNPLRKVIPYSARAGGLVFFSSKRNTKLRVAHQGLAGRKCAFLHWSMLFCAFSILLHLLPLIPWDWPVLLSKRHLYCHCLTFLFKLRFKEAVRALFFYCLGRTLRQCVLFACVLGANHEGKNSIIGRRTKDNFSTAKRDRALVHNVKKGIICNVPFKVKLPRLTGPDTLLNGQKLAPIRLSFSQDARNFATFWTAKCASFFWPHQVKIFTGTVPLVCGLQ